jgi:hypothetical protein
MRAPLGTRPALSIRAGVVGLFSAARAECSKLLRLPAPTETASNRGDYERRPNMGRFIRRQNVERYWRLLYRVTDESDRQRMLELLVEERQKQRDAGDEFI